LPLSPAGAVELRNEVARAVALELPGTLVFDYPTIDAIVDYIGGKVAAAAPGAAAPAHEQTEQAPRWAVTVLPQNLQKVQLGYERNFIEWFCMSIFASIP
jgi:hypothetical protein